MKKQLQSFKKIAFFVSMFLFTSYTFGQSAGFNTTFIVLSINGGSNTYYDLQASTTNPDFNGANLGSFCQGSTNLVFIGAEHNNYKCGGCDITSTRINYRIYPTSTPSGSFVINNIGFASDFVNGCGGRDQQWSYTGYNTNLLSGLAPGNYTMEVYSDQSTSCSGTQYASNGGANYKATFTVNAPVTPTFTAVAAICSGGSLSALPTTSNNGITGTWSPALNNTATTLYTFTPTAGQCATTTTLTITVNPNITPTFTAIAPICSGSSLSPLPTTSNNGITGTWSPALNNTATTLYTFTPTAGQCATTALMSIKINPLPTLGTVTATTVCENTPATVNMTGLLPSTTGSITYTNSLTGPTVFTVTATSDASGNFSFNTPNLPLAANGAVITFTGGTVTATGCSAAFIGKTVTVVVNANVTYYADADGDGYGNNAVSQVSCTGAPAGYVLNNTDCDDSNALIHASFPFYVDADHDGYGTGSLVSVCAVNGTTPPTGYSLNNTDCDDSNALVYQSGLLYIDVDGDHYTVGTPTVVCYGATVPTGYSLTSLGTDCDDTNALVNPGHAEILYNGIDDNCDGQIDEGHQIVTQLLPSVCGTTIATMSSSISATVIQNATGYRFKVTNNATSAVQIIDRTNAWFSLNQLPVYDYAASYSVQVQVQRNGIWLGYYGPACTIYSPGAGPSSSGTIAIVPTQCGQTLPLLSTIIYTNGLAGVTGWRYRITNTSTNQVQILDRAFSWFSMKMLPSYTYGVTYTVEVAVKTSGDYSAYGSACSVTMPPVPSLTAASCGATMSNNATVVYTSSLDMVTTCRFELTNMVTNQVIVIDRPVSWFNFSMVPNYTASTQYGVRVAVMTTGVFSGYGEACLVTSPGTAKSEEASQTPVTTVEDFKVMALPNPFSSNFGLTINTTSDAKVEVKIYDMIGKLLEVREIQASEIDQQSIGERYPSGVYNVIVTQGENIKTLRVIKR